MVEPKQVPVCEKSIDRAVGCAEREKEKEREREGGRERDALVVDCAVGCAVHVYHTSLIPILRPIFHYFSITFHVIHFARNRNVGEFQCCSERAH